MYANAQSDEMKLKGGERRKSGNFGQFSVFLCDILPPVPTNYDSSCRF